MEEKGARLTNKTKPLLRVTESKKFGFLNEPKRRYFSSLYNLET